MIRPQQLKIRAAGYGIVVVLGACAVAFLAYAAYLQLAAALAPAIAALLTGGALLLLAALTLACLGWSGTGRGDRRGRHRDSHDPMDGLEAMLDERVDPVLSRWLRRHPERAAAATLLLGIGAGYSRSVRRVLQDLYDQYVETERERRGTRRK